MSVNRRPRQQSERGAVAIVTGVTIVALLGMGALVVDLGNAFVERRDRQYQADFSALAGGALLPGRKTLVAPYDPSITKAAEYLNANGFDSVTEATLVDGNEVNGEVYFTDPASTDPAVEKEFLRVLTPVTRVNFGLGAVAGVSHVNINAEATVGAFSGGLVLPIYTFEGCDYGPQTILADSTDSYARVPTLHLASDTNTASVERVLIGGVSPARAALNATGATLTIEGNNLNGTTSVGFFRTGSPPPTPVTATPSSVNNNQVTVTVPAAVTAVETAWYVRVMKGGTWSPVTAEDIAPLGVGSAPVECDDDASDGNLGVVELPRTDVSSPNDELTKNFALGPQSDLLPYPAGLTLCNGQPHPPYVDPPNPNGNCVDTQTGVPNPSGILGLIEGKPSIGVPKGRLDKDNSALCGGSKVASGWGSYTVNNDSLTCFFTNSTVTIEDISRSNYTRVPNTPAPLSPQIYNSPRFIWQPVLRVEPSTGGSNRYTIVDFRPGFITDQPLSAKSGSPVEATLTNNGFTIDSSGLSTLRAVLFDADALPSSDGGGPVTPYLGTGPVVVRLVN